MNGKDYELEWVMEDIKKMQKLIDKIIMDIDELIADSIEANDIDRKEMLMAIKNAIDYDLEIGAIRAKLDGQSKIIKANRGTL